jgi:hypothetical protein
MNKRTISLAVSLMIFAFSLAHGATMSQREINIDRPGGDLTSIVLPIKNATLCENACAVDSRCVAWNLDARGGVPQCFLKSTVTNPVVSTGLTSGIKIP